NLDLISAGQPGADRNLQPAYPTLMRYAQFAVTILREAAAMDEHGNPPALDAIQANAQTNIIDAVTLQRALEDVVAGCQGPAGWVGPRTPVSIGRTAPVGPQGAVMAVVGQIQVLL